MHLHGHPLCVPTKPETTAESGPPAEVSQRNAQLKSELKSTCVHPRSRGARSETMVEVRPRSTRKASAHHAPAMLRCPCFAGTSSVVMSTICRHAYVFDRDMGVSIARTKEARSGGLFHARMLQPCCTEFLGAVENWRKSAVPTATRCNKKKAVRSGLSD